MVYLEEDVIYKADTESDCMYFIASGTVALITFLGKEVSDWKYLEFFLKEFLKHSYLKFFYVTVIYIYFFIFTIFVYFSNYT